MKMFYFGNYINTGQNMGLGLTWWHDAMERQLPLLFAMQYRKIKGGK